VHVAAWCIDHGVRSVAPVEQRPALRAAFRAVRQQKAGVLVLAKRDRIARDVVLAASVERAVSLAGARVVSASGEVHLVLDRHEQATILRARRLRSCGLSFRAIAARLAAEGRINRKGRPFFAAQVARMLADEGAAVCAA
jgi:hypothetical protein